MTESTKIGTMRRLKGVMLKRVHGMITCREFEEFINAYLDDELTSKERTRFKMHLFMCRECRDYLAAFERTIEVGSAVFNSSDEPVPNDVPESLINTILKIREGDEHAGDKKEK